MQNNPTLPRSSRHCGDVAGGYIWSLIFNSHRDAYCSGGLSLHAGEVCLVNRTEEQPQGLLWADAETATTCP